MSLLKDFPGRWGEITRIDLSSFMTNSVSPVTNINESNRSSTSSSISFKTRLRNFFHGRKENNKSHKLLSEWHATAIAGNDISSSCLYTAGICAQKGNQ